MQVIETNINCDHYWDIKDYQSRVVEVSNW
jgi:hypothetical protein